MTESELPRYLIASAKRALQGAISANVRQVSVGWDGFKNLFMRVIYAEQPTEDELENMEIVTAEILADIPFDHETVETVISGVPMSGLSSLAVVVYERVE